MPDLERLRQQISKCRNSSLLTLESVQGGDFATAFRCEFSDGHVVFAKTHPRPPTNFFSTEATSLEWLRSAAAKVPQVISFSDDDPAHLILDWIQPGRGGVEGDAEFGRMLAAVHSAAFPCFGRPDSRTTGSQSVPNRPSDSWSHHYAHQRLMYLSRLGFDSGTIPSELCDRIERLASRIDSFAPPLEPPSLLHGDLWAGNRVVGSLGKSWMVDPASFGGHREFDLAMMRLFGGYSEHCFRSYDEVNPLPEGWQDRVAFHQLAPLAVHTIKFGGHYVGALARAVAQYN